MTSTVLAVSAAYVVMGVLLLAVGLTSRFAWWVKAVAIVIASGFFIEVFFATKGLLGWPGAGQLPPKFQLLWVRVVEPDRLAGDKGAIYLWIEEVDDNNVPDGVPRAFRLPYSRPLADRSALARDEIMRGKPQQGTVEQLQGEEAKQEPNSDEMRSRQPHRERHHDGRPGAIPASAAGAARGVSPNAGADPTAQGAMTRAAELPR